MRLVKSKAVVDSDDDLDIVIPPVSEHTSSTIPASDDPVSLASTLQGLSHSFISEGHGYR